MLRGMLLAAGLLASAHAQTASAGPAPEPLAPGSGARVLSSTGHCPTFRWHAPEDAGHFELALYEVSAPGPDRDAGLTPVAMVTLPGTGRSWTPSGEQCTQPGRTYAWLLRGVSATGASEWSAEHWFTSPVATVPEREQITALLASVAEAGRQDARSSLMAQGTEPELTVVREMTAGEFTVIRVPGVSLGRITTDSDFESQAFDGLRAGRFGLLQPLPSTGNGATLSADLNAAPGVTFKFGAGDCSAGACDDLEARYLLATGIVVEGGAINFSAGFHGYSGSGGSGFFEVPSGTQVRVDDNAADCGGRPVVAVRLFETDADQIGIQAECGNAPAGLQ